MGQKTEIRVAYTCCFLSVSRLCSIRRFIKLFWATVNLILNADNRAKRRKVVNSQLIVVAAVVAAVA